MPPPPPPAGLLGRALLCAGLLALSAQGREGEGGGGCSFWADVGLAQPLGDEGDSSGAFLWVLDGGVEPGSVTAGPDHQFRGLDLPVVEGGLGATPSLLIGGGCPRALPEPSCAYSVAEGGRVMGGGVLAHRGEWAEEDPFEIGLQGMSEGVHNLTVTLGPPCGFVGHVVFARVLPPLNPTLEVAFPPEEGYEFGRDLTPFLLMHVHAGGAKHTSVYARLRTRHMDSGREIVSGDFWDVHGHRVHIPGTELPGHYECFVTIMDVLKRPIIEAKRVTFTVSAELSQLACNSGNSNCRPQTAPPREAQLLTTSLNASHLSRCPALLEQAFSCEGCSGHGACMSIACVCDADWIGERCEHHTLSGLRFLPDRHPIDRAARCHQTAVLERGSEALASRIDDLQFPPMCGSLFQRRFNKTQGLGVTLRWIALSLSVSIERGETLVVGGKWRAFNFEGISNCSVTDWDWEEIRTRDFDMPAAVTIPFPGVEQGQLWWVAAMTRATFQPSLWMQVRLRRLKNELGWPASRVLGLHARHGDSCADRTRPACVSAEKFFAEAEAAARRYDMREIFLATDDQEVVEASRIREGFRYMSVSMDRRALFGSNMYIEHRIEMGIVDRKGVSEATFTDLFLLSECDALVGSFGSHFSKAAYELMVANKGDFMPYVSVDRPWEPLRPVLKAE